MSNVLSGQHSILPKGQQEKDHCHANCDGSWHFPDGDTEELEAEPPSTVRKQAEKWEANECNPTGNECPFSPKAIVS